MLPAARLRHSPAASGVLPLLPMMFVEVDLPLATLPLLCCYSAIILRHPAAIGTRPADSVSAVENPMGPGCPGWFGQTEQYTAVGKTCA